MIRRIQTHAAEGNSPALAGLAHTLKSTRRQPRRAGLVGLARSMEQTRAKAWSWTPRAAPTRWPRSSNARPWCCVPRSVERRSPPVRGVAAQRCAQAAVPRATGLRSSCSARRRSRSSNCGASRVSRVSVVARNPLARQYAEAMHAGNDRWRKRHQIRIILCRHRHFRQHADARAGTHIGLDEVARAR